MNIILSKDSSGILYLRESPDIPPIYQTNIEAKSSTDTEYELNQLAKRYNLRAEEILGQVASLDNIIFVDATVPYGAVFESAIHVVSSGVFPLTVDSYMWKEVEDIREHEPNSMSILIHRVWVKAYNQFRTYSAEISLEKIPAKSNRLQTIFRKFTIDKIIPTL